MNTDTDDWEKFSTEAKEENLFQLKSERLKKALKQITPEDRTVLLLKYQDDVSIKELEKRE